MSFHNGVPITVVSGVQSMRIPTENTSRRRAEEDERLEAISVARAARHARHTMR
jgi:hypothetical protein